MADLRERILDIIGEPNMTGFATVTESGAPWVRYVMSAASEDLTIRFSTFVDSRKVSHISKDPRVHLVCGVTDPEEWSNYLQIAGTAEVVTDIDEKKAFWNPELEHFFDGPEDPNYAVVRVNPSRIELYGREDLQPEVWTAD